MMSYAAALEQLARCRRFGMRPGLERIHALLAALDHPERALAVVHVGGTNGKGSTAATVERIARAAGVKTGLFTSPHLLRFTERLQIDGVEIGPAEAAELLSRVFSAAPEGATFFEVATAMALCGLRERGVELAVIEVGLGGRLDSTNVFARPRCTVITSIGLEHTDVLGPTVRHIALEKAGIFRAGAPAVIACADDAAHAVLEGAAADVGAPLARLGREIRVAPFGAGLDYDGPGGPLSIESLGLFGPHQLGNAALALAATALVGITDPGARRRGVSEVRWPGRLERIAPDVLVDAAHNAEGARALAAALPSLADGRPLTLVVGVARDKDAGGMLAALRPVAARLIATRPPSSRALAPEALLPFWPGAEVEADPARALALARTGGLVVVAGSMFLVGEVRRLVLGEAADPFVVQDPAPGEKL